MPYSVQAVDTTSQEDLEKNAFSSTVIIVSHDQWNNAFAHGTGFFIDEEILITNRHVIDTQAKYFRIYLRGADGTPDTGCFKDVTLSDMKVNLEDDVAYIRAYMHCPHSSVFFSPRDPEVGERIDVLGYTTILEETGKTVVRQTLTAGIVLTKDFTYSTEHKTHGPWILTNAIINFGNSGGPVLQAGLVAGIAVAAPLDANRKPIGGLIIPMSVVRDGLLYANDSTFGYTPQAMQDSTVYKKALEKKLDEMGYKIWKNPINPEPANGTVVQDSDCQRTLGKGAERTGYNQKPFCRCRYTYKMNASGTQCLEKALSPENLARHGIVPGKTKTRPDKQERICKRVDRYRSHGSVYTRVNKRIQKRFGFRCDR